MEKIKALSLFSGIGGFELALNAVWGNNIEIVAQVESDKFCQNWLAGFSETRIAKMTGNTVVPQSIIPILRLIKKIDLH